MHSDKDGGKVMELADAETEKLMEIVEEAKKKAAPKAGKKDKGAEKAPTESAEEADKRIAKERADALNRFMARAEQSFGRGAVMRWGEKVANTSVSVVPTGCLGIDLALGIGGVPRGRIIEIFGPEASGKTTVTLHIVAEVQKMRGVAAFIDAEHALDPVYAQKLGVNIDDLYISQPDSGEQALDIAEEMVKSGAIDLIVIDSVAALVPKSEIDGDMGQATMGVHARLMSQALRKLTAICGRTGTIIIFTNQLRSTITTWGGGETTTGGRALRFYASIRMDIRKDSRHITEGDTAIGSDVTVKIAKNKLAPPFKSAKFNIIWGEGIAYEVDMLNVGVANGVVNKSGSWYSYGEHRLGQGHEKAAAFLRDNGDLCVSIENEVREKNGMKSLTEIRSAPMRELVVIEARPSKKKKSTKSETTPVIAEIGDDFDDED